MIAGMPCAGIKTRLLDGGDERTRLDPGCMFFDRFVYIHIHTHTRSIGRFIGPDGPDLAPGGDALLRGGLSRGRPAPRQVSEGVMCDEGGSG